MIRSLLIVIASAAALAGCATLPAPKGTETAVAARCLRGVPRGGAGTCQAFTRTYSARQLRQTGHTNLARALQSLDPGVTATGTP